MRKFSTSSSHIKKSAFSLFELTFVLIIAGIIIGGVMNGSGLIKSSRLVVAKSATSKSTVLKTEGLVAWYETSLRNSFKGDEIKDQSQLTAWYDNSPGSAVQQKNALTRTASSAVVYEETGINNIPSVMFNGSGSFSLSALYQGPSVQLTIFLVFQPLSAPDATAEILLDSHSSGSTNSLGIKNNTVNFDAGSTVNTGTVTNAASFFISQNYIAAIYFNRESSAAYVNDATTLVGNGNVNPGTNTLTGLTIGTNKSGSAGFNGYISEIIIYNRPLKLQERKDIMSYLAKKYRITVTNL